MKKEMLQLFRSFTLSLMVLVAISAAFVSCSDDDEAPIKNTFSVGNNTIEIKIGAFKNDLTASVDEGADYNHSLGFLSDGFVLNGGMAEGTGSAISFELYSDDADLVTSEFTYSGLENGVANQIWDASAEFGFTNMIIEGEFYRVEDGEAYQITEGALKVTKSGTQYTISYSGKAVLEGTETEVDVKLNYTGPLQVVE